MVNLMVVSLNQIIGAIKLSSIQPQYVTAGIKGAVQGLQNTHLNFTLDGLSWPMSDSEAGKSDTDVKICI